MQNEPESFVLSDLLFCPAYVNDLLFFIFAFSFSPLLFVVRPVRPVLLFLKSHFECRKTHSVRVRFLGESVIANPVASLTSNYVTDQ